MRNPLALEMFNEAICGLLKRSFRESLRRTDELSIACDYDGAVRLQDSEEMLDSARSLHARVMAAVNGAYAGKARGPASFCGEPVADLL